MCQRTLLVSYRNRLRIAFTSTSWGTCALNSFCFPARKASTSFRPSIICLNCVFMLSPISLENTIGPFPYSVALCHRQIFFLILRKNGDKKNRKSLVAPDIHNPGRTAFSHSFACDPDLSKSARSTDQVSTFWVSRNQCHDVRTLLLAKELVGNREGREVDGVLYLDAAAAFREIERKPFATASFCREVSCTRPAAVLPEFISISPRANFASSS